MSLIFLFSSYLSFSITSVGIPLGDLTPAEVAAQYRTTVRNTEKEERK